MWNKIKSQWQKKLSWILQQAPLLVLLFLLSITWVYFERMKTHSDEELHALLQNRVQIAISEYVETHTKNISSIVFHKLWTKDLPHSDKVQVFFSYSLFDDNTSTQGEILIDGEAQLTPLSKDKNNWQLTNFTVNNSFVDFSEALVIRSSADF